jgi:hypothetical protein
LINFWGQNFGRGHPFFNVSYSEASLSGVHNNKTSLAPGNNGMPIGIGLLFSFLAPVDFVCCQRKTGYFFTAFKVRESRVLANVPD